MKKAVILCLATLLVLTNITIAKAAISAPGAVDLGTDYCNKEFSKVFHLYNDGPGYEYVTIEVQDYDLGLKVSPTTLKIPGNQHAAITISGHFPSMNGAFCSELIIKDDTGSTNDKIVAVTGWAKPEDSGDKLPAPKNIVIMVEFPCPIFGWMSWDAVPNAKSYKVYFPKPLDETIITSDCKLNFYPPFQWCLDGKFTVTVTAIDKNGNSGKKGSCTYTFN